VARRYVAQAGREHVQVRADLPLDLGDGLRPHARGSQFDRQRHPRNLLTDMHHGDKSRFVERPPWLDLPDAL